jgi:hypothetical protein
LEFQPFDLLQVSIALSIALSIHRPQHRHPGGKCRAIARISGEEAHETNGMRLAAAPLTQNQSRR